MSRELQRLVTPDEDSIKFGLKWAEAMLRQWFEGSAEAALFVGEPRRTLDQNSKMWPMLEDVARQVPWFVDGAPRKLTKEEWKDVFTASHRKQSVAPGIDGGFVVLGARTSRMSKRQLSELIELIYAFGSEHGVAWSEPAKKTIAEHNLSSDSGSEGGPGAGTPQGVTPRSLKCHTAAVG